MAIPRPLVKQTYTRKTYPFRALRISKTRSTFVRPISSKACVRVTASKFASTKASHFSLNYAASCWSAAWKMVAAFST